MTSANVSEFTITKISNNECVGRFRKNWLCKLPDFSELLKYEPLSEHEIQEWGYDEEEEYWEEEPENLENFLRRMKTNKIIMNYFNNK